ncbi:unnamed protein product [Caenorhabditis auriculariae]|uniref:Uncharacterized protein n=1 Tax=Caenorhabditis auriculariae TaxID=2777116 RepID=A0A8S1HLZ8_9PELO|nr:unnamed protein product [Caenorhabditis auriculariae]
MASKLKDRRKRAEETRTTNEDSESCAKTNGSVDDAHGANSTIASKIDKRRAPKRTPTTHVKINMDKDNNYCVRNIETDDSDFSISVANPIGSSLEDRLRELTLKYRKDEYTNKTIVAKDSRTEAPERTDQPPPVPKKPDILTERF